MDDLLARARSFAAAKHAGQQRRYKDAPYHVHLEQVAVILSQHGYDSPVILAAAYLHDTVEKTETSFEELIETFGPEVSELVYWLTDAQDESKETRALLSAWRLARAPLEAKLIKLADMIDNTQDIAEHDREFARAFAAEKKIIVAKMTEAEGSQLSELPLYRHAVRELDAALAK